MNIQQLNDTALVADDKRLLAMDESTRTCDEPQQIPAHRARCDRAARRGEYTAPMESTRGEAGMFE